jgi:CRP-like cAMP-binding protein
MQWEYIPDAESLRRLKSLSWLSAVQIERLAASMSVERVKRHQVVFSEGETSNMVYILLSGAARLSFLNRGGERVLVGLIGAGEIFGVSALLGQTRRPFRCDAFSDCWVGAIKSEAFVDTFLGVPFDVYSHAMEVTVGRWWAMLLRYANSVGINLRERLAIMLLELAAKFGVQDARGTILTLRLTHEDLADLVGASRQKVTEHMNMFERQQVIIREGRRLILLPRKLQEIVQSDLIG